MQQSESSKQTDGEGREFLTGKDLSQMSEHGRSKPPKINEEQDDFRFMQIDVDYYTVQADQMPNYLPRTNSDEYAVLRMYGVTEGGNSVMAHIHQFLSYMYVEITDEHQKEEITEQDLSQLKNHINQTMHSANYVQHIEVLEKSSVLGYSANHKKFLKIFVSLPKNIAQLRTKFEQSDFNYKGNYNFFGRVTYESNIPFALRFMIDNDIVGMQWIQILAGKYILRRPQQKMSNCQFEFDVVDFLDIQSVPLPQMSKIAPLRIMSFDIECAAQKGRFPTPDKDPVIQIANIVKVHGESEPIIRNVFTLKSCAAIVGTKVHCFETEQELLLAWRDFVQEADPDLITGYNTQNFDLPYLIDRANHLMINNFSKLTRLKSSMSRARDQTSNIKALGMRESKETNIEGRVQIDMMQVIIRDHKLRSYSLNNVSYHFLAEQKEDVPHNIISDLQNGDEFSRRRLAIYCVKDAYLPLRLLDKLMCLFNLTEMSRVTGVPISYLFSRGQQIKVASQIYRKAKTVNLIIPTKRSEKTDEQFEGATVIEPKRGYYTHPIATLDFASLYPSIMMAHNLCYTTYIPIDQVKHYSPDDFIKTPNGHYFMKTSVKKGILPEILQELISARKQAKKDLKAATDPFERGVLDGRQLALKISANSVYGFTGAQVGQLPLLAISSSVTAFGREMIEMTKATVIEHYSKKNGYEFDADVIYGDTDSVMVKFGTTDRAEAMRLGEEAAAFVSQKFVSPIKLEFEKIYHPYLLMNKKRYAGMYWTNTVKPDKMDAKGIETVRRDNCRLVQEIVQGALDILLVDFDKEKAIEHCKGLISDLLQNRIDLSLLVISKGLSKKIGDDDDDEPKGGKNNAKTTYASNSAHVQLAKKMQGRDAASAPNVGDRVAYVMVKGLKGSKGYQNSEDPIYVLENNLPIDYNYYIDNQIKQPLIRIFEPILGDEKMAERELFTGEHMRNVYQPKLNVTKGLGMFAKVKASCMSCKNVLKPGWNDAICELCQPKKKSIFIERKIELNKAEKVYGDLWVQCQRCQSSLHQDILCTSRDCPIFYRRVKAKKNLEELGDQLEKLNEW